MYVMYTIYNIQYYINITKQIRIYTAPYILPRYAISMRIYKNVKIGIETTNIYI